MRYLRKEWTEDANPSDILEWLADELKKVPVKDFGGVRLEIFIFPRQFGES